MQRRHVRAHRRGARRHGRRRRRRPRHRRRALPPPARRAADGHPAAGHERHGPVAGPGLARARARLARAARHARAGPLPRARPPRLRPGQRAGARAAGLAGPAGGGGRRRVPRPRRPDGAAAARRQARRREPGLRAHGVRARARGALRGRPQRGGDRHAHALRGSTAGVTAGPRSIGFRRAALHLGGLWALAFAQPLFHLLGENAQFFVARGSTRGDILVLAFGYTLLPPLAGAALVWGVGRIRPVAGWCAQLVLVALLVAALLLPPLGDALGGSAAAIGVALLAGAAGAALYAASDGVRTFAGVLGAAPVVVIALFLLVSPVRELLLPGDGAGELVGPPRSSTPIVHVVLDELPEDTVDTGDGRIDPTLFPNLARFARDATWYRNATTVDDLTQAAVPAQLTGEQPEPGDLPTVRDHPRNLFTLFGRSHDLVVVEPITDLCPERLCNKARLSTLPRLEALREDLTVVAAHVLLPADLRAGLPAVDGAWEDFDPGTPPGALQGGPKLKPGILERLARNDATAGFERAIAALDRPRSRPPLVFVHSTLPHGPWRFVPDGRRSPIHRQVYPGFEEVWSSRQWLGDQAWQRHVLQT